MSKLWKAGGVPPFTLYTENTYYKRYTQIKSTKALKQGQRTKVTKWRRYTVSGIWALLKIATAIEPNSYEPTKKEKEYDMEVKGQLT